MMLAMFQIAVVALIATYFVWWRLRAHRRNHQSWKSILTRLHRVCNPIELSAHFPWKEGLSISPNQTWACIQGPRGLWTIYRNAGIMLELADFAAHRTGVDPATLGALRSDATQIRLSALKALAEYAIHYADENVHMNTFRVASLYTGMAAHMTEFLQLHAEPALPSFVAAL